MNLRPGGKDLIDGVFNNFTGFANALLNPTEPFVMLALDVLEIVMRERGPLLLHLALGDVPVTFDFKCVHRLKLQPSLALDDGV